MLHWKDILYYAKYSNPEPSHRVEKTEKEWQQELPAGEPGLPAFDLRTQRLQTFAGVRRPVGGGSGIRREQRTPLRRRLPSSLRHPQLARAPARVRGRR